MTTVEIVVESVIVPVTTTVLIVISTYDIQKFKGDMCTGINNSFCFIGRSAQS